MKATANTTPAVFQPVTVTLVCESQQELDTLTAIAARSVKIPEAIFHGPYMTASQVKLTQRGIGVAQVREVLESLFSACLSVGGKP